MKSFGNSEKPLIDEHNIKRQHFVRLINNIESTMLFLGLLLIHGIGVSPSEAREKGYDVRINGSTLISVKATISLFLFDFSSDSLDLSNKGLDIIEEGAFGKLKIKNLSLANNNLEFLPLFGFRLLDKLVHLSLANNKLETVRYYFGGLNNLQVLDIRNNRISRLEKGDFYGLTKATNILSVGNGFGVIRRVHFENPYTLLMWCVEHDVVKSVKVYDENGDRKNEDECVTKIRVLKGTTVELMMENIKGFTKGWYGLRELDVRSLALQFNEITNITSALLNDLPEGLKSVNLACNKINELKNGVICNRNLRDLNLIGNPIANIESQALANTDNLEIHLPGDKPNICKLI